MSANSIDWDVVDLIARERKQSHDGTRTGDHRPVKGQDKVNMDRTGAAAEVAFAKRYNLSAPRVDLVEGDSGYDFIVDWDNTETAVEIKSSDYRNPNLMVPSIRDIEAPDVYVLYSAKYQQYLRPIGWVSTDEFLAKGERQDSKIGDYCIRLDSNELLELPSENKITEPKND